MIADLSVDKSIKIFLAVMGFLIFLLFFKNEPNIILLTEYGLIESLTAFFYLIAICICANLIFILNGLPKIYFLGWLVLTLVFFGEETSYLQHYIGYETPQYFLENNAQQELNIHNISTVNDGSITDALINNKFQLSILLKSQNLFNIGFAFYFLLLPLSNILFSTIKNIVSTLSIPTVGIRFVLCVWIPIVFTIAIGFTDPNKETFIRAYMAESRELIFALAISLFFYSFKKSFAEINLKK